MPSLRNIGVSDFVPDFGAQVGHLIPNNAESPLEYAVAAMAVVGFWAALGIAAIGALGVGAELIGATVPFDIDALYSMEIGIPGIGDVLLLPYIAVTGLIAYSMSAFLIQAGRITDPSEMIEDDVVPTVMYFSLGLAFIQIRGPGVGAFARASVWTFVVIGVVAWVISAGMTRMRG